MTYTAARTDSLLETDFRIGVVVSKSIRLFLGNIVAFMQVSCVLGLTNFTLNRFGERDFFDVNGTIIDLGCMVLQFVLWALASAIIFYATYQQMCGRTANVMEAASYVLPRSVSLIGVTLISILGVSIAVVLPALMVILPFMSLCSSALFPIAVVALAGIPGIFLMAIWHVAGVACAVESLGVPRSLGRSRELTRGYRWEILALLLVIVVATLIMVALAGAAYAAGIGAWGEALVDVLWPSLSGGFNAVLIAVSYYYLRIAKDGGDGEQIAAAFD